VSAVVGTTASADPQVITTSSALVDPADQIATPIKAAGSSSTTVEVIPSAQASPSPLPAPSISRHGVIVSAREATWLSVTIDNADPKEAMLQPGEQVSYHGEDRVVLSIGNLAGVDVIYNGKSVTLPKTSSNVARNITFPPPMQTTTQP
jgi:hypothetical protein